MGCPLAFLLEVLVQPGATGGIKHGLVNVAGAALITDGEVSVAVWVHGNNHMELTSSQLTGGEMVTNNI